MAEDAAIRRSRERGDTPLVVDGVAGVADGAGAGTSKETGRSRNRVGFIVGSTVLVGEDVPLSGLEVIIEPLAICLRPVFVPRSGNC